MSDESEFAFEELKKDANNIVVMLFENQINHYNIRKIQQSFDNNQEELEKDQRTIYYLIGLRGHILKWIKEAKQKDE